MLSSTEAFLLGVAGATAAEFLAVWPYRKMPLKEWPKWTRRISYWSFAVILLPIGGFLAWLLTGDHEVSRYLAFHTGVASPLLLERLAANAPDFGAGSAS